MLQLKTFARFFDLTTKGLFEFYLEHDNILLEIMQAVVTFCVESLFN